MVSLAFCAVVVLATATWLTVSIIAVGPGTIGPWLWCLQIWSVGAVCLVDKVALFNLMVEVVEGHAVGTKLFGDKAVDAFVVFVALQLVGKITIR